MSKPTYADFMRVTEAAVADRGADWCYPALPSGVEQDDWHGYSGECVYALPDGTPACIVGEALYRLNEAWLPPHDLIEDAGIVLDTLGPNAFASEADFDNIRVAARRMQGSQDAGISWGEALEAGRRAVLGLLIGE